MNCKMRHLSLMLIPFLVLLAQAQPPTRYRELKNIVNVNVGVAHATRGQNMNTFIALRSCVSNNDVGVVDELVEDKNAVVRMACARVLVHVETTGEEGV